MSSQAVVSPDSAQLPEITPRVVAGEVQDFLRAHERRRRQFPRAALVGFFAGVVAVLFRRALEEAESLRLGLIAFAQLFPAWGFLLPMALGALGAGSGVYLVQRFAPETAGSGIPHLKAVLHRLKGMKWYRVLLVKFVAGLLALGGGLTLGRQGPSVQMGGAVGQMVSQWFQCSARERQTLIAAGAGAGLSAAFNAPLSGLIFVLEEVQRDFAPTVFTATFVACVVADVVSRVLMGQSPAFAIEMHPVPGLSHLPAFLVLGLLAGLVGVLFNRTLLATRRLFSKTASWPRGSAAALVGGVIGLIGFYLPAAQGGGHSLVEQIVGGGLALQSLLLLFVVRFACTMISCGTGAAGGFFAPLLVLGAQIGFVVGLLGGRALPTGPMEPTMFAVVGMGALFTAVVRAPLTGIVLIVEMTGNYALILPLLVACFCAYGVADLLGDQPIYEALLERDLLRSQDGPRLESNLLLELKLAPGAAFEGKRIEELQLPEGCLIISVARGIHTLVPDSSTVLQVGDAVTAIVAPAAADGANLLRRGLGGR